MKEKVQEKRGVKNSPTKICDRLFLSELVDLSMAESPKRGEGVFFIVADDNLAAIHSEPQIHENRLFFSVLIGDKAEIEELYLRWYP